MPHENATSVVIVAAVSAAFTRPSRWQGARCRDPHRPAQLPPLSTAALPVATGGLSPGEIASPLRVVLRHNPNTECCSAKWWISMPNAAVSFCATARRVRPRDRRHRRHASLFGNDQWAPLAPGLKTIEDATEIRSRVLSAFESAEREPDLAKRRAWLTFAIVGAARLVSSSPAPWAKWPMTPCVTISAASIPPSPNSPDRGEDRVLRYFPGLSAKAENNSSAERTFAHRSQVTSIDPDGVAVQVGGQEQRIAAAPCCGPPACAHRGWARC